MVAAAFLLTFFLLLSAAADAQDMIPPDVVQLENVQVENGTKTVRVGNTAKHYSLSCDIKADGCITPQKGKNYFLLNEKTRFKMPGAKDFITLSFVQDWTTKYNRGENIGLVPEQGNDLGMFIRDPTFSTATRVQGADVEGAGVRTCSQFAKDYQSDPKVEILYTTWALGFLSGMNAILEAGSRPTRDLGTKTWEEKKRFIREFCDEHPLQDYMTAVLELGLSLPLKSAEHIK